MPDLTGKSILRSGIRDSGGYDTMQVCMGGHVITDTARRNPEEIRLFCAKCGAATIDDCPECKQPIQGRFVATGMPMLGSVNPKPPNNCSRCGSAYPWRQAAIANAIGVLELEIENASEAEVHALVMAVAQNAPTAQLSVLKIRKGLKHLAKPAYDVAIKVVADLISAEVKRKVGL